MHSDKKMMALHMNTYTDNTTRGTSAMYIYIYVCRAVKLAYMNLETRTIIYLQDIFPQLSDTYTDLHSQRQESQPKITHARTNTHTHRIKNSYIQCDY